MVTQRERLLLKALKEIKATQGKVCTNFELCTHTACQSSYASWEIANKALNEYNETLGKVDKSELIVP